MAFHCLLTLKTVVGCLQASESRKISKANMGHLESFGSRSSPRECILSCLNTKTGSDDLYIFSVFLRLPIIWQIFTELNFLKIKSSYAQLKKGAITGDLCFKNPNSFYVHGRCSKLSGSIMTTPQSSRPCTAFQSHHIISRLNYPEN